MTRPRLAGLIARLRALELATRPESPELVRALARRWQELPSAVRTPAQAIGRRTAGCEGTHGVFPRCDLACTPCYHSREANRVGIDGEHTVAEVTAQMQLLRERRGPGQNAQLIGGEVTLLSPDDHARALQAMVAHGRKPMSMSHGDFDYEYLERLALGPHGRARFDRLSFAGHFDSMMFGRRGVRRATKESELNAFRRRFCEMFQRLQREHGVAHYLAHNMTVTPANIGQLAEVIRECQTYGFRMFSFQPAAFVGNQARWKDDYRRVSDDDVWTEIEKGAGCRLPHGVFQIGHPLCNRTVYGAYVGNRYVPLLDDRDPRDLRVRDAFYRVFGGMDFAVAPGLLAVRLMRALARQPFALALALGWLARFIRRAGGLRVLRRARVRMVTFVMHRFMDAREVRPAWELMRNGQVADNPRLRLVQERLQACSYAMAHPESDELVPACAQHAVLDERENLRLAALLPPASRLAAPRPRTVVHPSA